MYGTLKKNFCVCWQQRGTAEKIPAVCVPLRPVCGFTVCRPLYRGGGVGIR